MVRIGRSFRISAPPASKSTPASCEFRDLAADCAAMGYRFYGLSNRDSDYQPEAVERLHLTYPLLSDPDFSAATELVRSTLIVVAGNIAHANLGITDTDAHPRRLLAQLRDP